MLGLYVTQINTLRPRQNGRRFADDIFKCVFLNENVRLLTKISLTLVPKGPLFWLNKIFIWAFYRFSTTVHVVTNTCPQWCRHGTDILRNPLHFISHGHLVLGAHNRHAKLTRNGEVWSVFWDFSSLADYKLHHCRVLYSAMLYHVIVSAPWTHLKEFECIYMSGFKSRKTVLKLFWKGTRILSNPQVS